MFKRIFQKQYYLNIEKAEEAFKTFIKTYKRKDEIEIFFYTRLGIKKNIDCAFIGYFTSNGGFHGIHYNKMFDSFRFGTLDRELNLKPMSLAYRECQLIPEWWKLALNKVASTRLEMVIKNKK
ncbi:MAG: hypothetical protein NVS1B13_16560 [Flavisolibacter sp.]